MRVEQTPLAGLVILHPDIHRDARGEFLETYRAEHCHGIGIDRPFVQDNVSCSRNNVLRGLHYQQPRPQGKLVCVVSGEAFDVAVDLRRPSPTFGKWFGTRLSSADYRQLWIPEGFAHGFYVVSASATVVYKCTDYYVPDAEKVLRWDDPVIGIEWPAHEPLLSPKDAAAPALRELSDSDLFDG